MPAARGGRDGARRPLGAEMRRPPDTAQADEFGLGDGAHNTYGSYGTVKAVASDAGAWIRKTATWLENSDETDPALWMTWCCECQEEFRPRRLKAPFVLAWLLLQVMGVLFQASMLMEIWQHLVDFEGTLQANCGPQHMQGGVCLGPAWNLSYSGVVTFPATAAQDGDSADFDMIIPADRTFNFETRSQPATFLVGVEPLPPHASAGWKLDLRETRGPEPGYPFASGAGVPAPPIELRGHGKKYMVQTSRRTGQQPCRWAGSMNLNSKYSDVASVHTYVVDSRIAHLEDIHNQHQCSFEQSWQNFSERQNGQHHRVLSFTWHATAFFMFVSLCCTGVMIRRFFYYVEGGKLLSRLIAAKFIMQDVPQQLCIVAYMYGWFAPNGLRCQMCLFHPQHCDQQYPLHWSNLMLCLFTMLSACANQLLLQVKSPHKEYDEEEECFQCAVRFALLAVSTLPFSTAMLVLSHSLLGVRSILVFFLVGLPCVIGWSALVCLPMAAACDDDF